MKFPFSFLLFIARTDGIDHKRRPETTYSHHYSQHIIKEITLVIEEIEFSFCHRFKRSFVNHERSFIVLSLNLISRVERLSRIIYALFSSSCCLSIGYQPLVPPTFSSFSSISCFKNYLPSYLSSPLSQTYLRIHGILKSRCVISLGSASKLEIKSNRVHSSGISLLSR